MSCCVGFSLSCENVQPLPSAGEIIWDNISSNKSHCYSITGINSPSQMFIEFTTKQPQSDIKVFVKENSPPSLSSFDYVLSKPNHPVGIYVSSSQYVYYFMVTDFSFPSNYTLIVSLKRTNQFPMYWIVIIVTSIAAFLSVVFFVVFSMVVCCSRRRSVNSYQEI